MIHELSQSGWKIRNIFAWLSFQFTIMQPSCKSTCFSSFYIIYLLRTYGCVLLLRFNWRDRASSMLLLLIEGSLNCDSGMASSCLRIILGFVSPGQRTQRCNRGRGHYDLRNPSHFSSRRKVEWKNLRFVHYFGSTQNGE